MIERQQTFRPLEPNCSVPIVHTSDRGNNGPAMQGLKDLKEPHEGSQRAGSIFARLTPIDPEAMALIRPICDHSLHQASSPSVPTWFRFPTRRTSTGIL